MPTDKRHAILIVEDERIVAKDLQQTLVDMGYDAFAIASSAEEALSRASERCPDLVLMDIRIKGQRDGIETAILLRERFGVPVVYLTAHADEATIARAKVTEPYGYLMKPVKSAELRSAIEVSIYKHEMERRLRERERWFSTTLRSIADAVVAVDLAGNVRFMNAAAEVLTGVAAAAAIGRPVRDVVRLLSSGPGPQHPTSPFDQVLAQKSGLLISEARLQHATHAERIISDSVSPVIDDGHMVGAVMVFRDVTEQKLMRRQLELSDRLASLGTMAVGIAHEVNNPLAVVLANATYVLEELRHQQRSGEAAPRGLSEAVQALTELEAGARQIAGIVADLQAFSPPTQPADGGGDVAAATAWAVRSTAHELRDRAQVTTQVASVPRVKLDETRLAQVLVNLLMNAAHAIPPGAPARHTVVVAASVVDANVVIEVRDTGGGIAPDVLMRVFEPFYTTKQVGPGTGLGLAVCHGIATSVGGRIDVESRLGHGSTFRVTLPIMTPREVLPSITASATTPLRVGKILVIDDDPLVVQTMQRMLRIHTVVSITDAREALALLARGESFDLIFSDVVMPWMTGIQLYERLLVEAPDAVAHVVFLTGGAVDAQMSDFLAVVRNVCLTKPFSAHELRAFVQQRLADL
jgi:two-component system, cell cycle sensor histidine kinase and response regulator CckA